MIDIKSAMLEVEKFVTAKLDYPPEVAGMKLLGKALAKHARSEHHAAAVVDGWIEKWPQWPKPSEITQLCQLITDPKQAHARQAREKCDRCHGTGYVEVQGEFGMTAAYPCTHLPMTESDARMGLKIPPAMRPRYGEEARQADQAHVELMKRRMASGDKGFPRVTQEDIDSLLAASLGGVYD